MRRRSSVAPSVTIAPVRLDEVPGLMPQPPRQSFASRQLSFTGNKSADTKLRKSQSSISSHVSVRPRCSAKSNESVLAETIMEEDCSVAEPKALRPQVPINAASGNLVKEKSSSIGRVSMQPSFNQKSRSSNVSVRDQNASKEDSTIPKPKTTSPKDGKSTHPSKTERVQGLSTLSNRCESIDKGAKSQTLVKKLSLSETKIPKPQVFSASSLRSTEAQLNSTAAFEDVEIAVLTSTPHPERISKRILLSTDKDQQLKLFLSEQRSVMQAMKLSFQKLNLVLDSQLQVNLETTNLLKQIKESQGSFQFNPVTNNVLNSKDNLALVSSEKVSCNNFEPDKFSFKMLSPCQEDKENVSIQRPIRPEYLYREMKSQLACLKTPTTIRKSGPMCAETPQTYLSNAVHHQLETLFDDSEVLK
ncbi:Bifunctional protein GlmU [Frankliniella fusca]|uniref:Bifunctional protein GlmU n=1 Tax=Frankliniella fusca TaxID=407009 RepID=A0AAE1LSC5_9NEOP|nr:Bifunctional protein GlmU [Frankliniella fusca]